MQQKIQSACRCPQSGKAVDVGEFSDVETESLPVSHIADTTPQNDELRPNQNYRGTFRNTETTASSDGSSRVSIAAGAAIILIRFYQKAISPWLPCTCRFEPSCSHYAVEAFRKRGFFMGVVLTVWRLLRCQPFAESGYDPVPDRGFRSRKPIIHQHIEKK